MPLRWQKVDLPFGFGMDQSEVSHTLDAPKLRSLLNGRIEKDKSVCAREGYQRVVSDISPRNLQTWSPRLFGFRGALYAVDTDVSAQKNVKHNLNALDSDLDRWDEQGSGLTTRIATALPEATVVDRVGIARDIQYDQENSDWASDDTSGVAVIAWQQAWTSASPTATLIFAVAININTGAVVKPAQQVGSSATCARPRVVFANSTFYVLYDVVAANELRCIPFSPSGISWGTDTAIITDLHADGVWDAVQATNAFHVVYKESVGAALRVQRFTATTDPPSSTASATYAEIPVCLGVSLDQSSNRMWIGVGRATPDVRYRLLNTSSTTAYTPVVGSTAVTAVTRQPTHVATSYISASLGVVAWSVAGTAALQTYTKFAEVTSGGVIGTVVTNYAMQLVSKLLSANSCIYANVLYDANGNNAASTSAFGRDSDGFQTIFTLAMASESDTNNPSVYSTFRQVATWMRGHAGKARSVSTLCRFGSFRAANSASDPAVYAFSASDEFVQYLFNQPGDVDYVTGKQGVDLCKLRLTDWDKLRAVEYGQQMMFGGGQPWTFDGLRLNEHGFAWPPENTQMAAVGGGALSAGSYQVAVVWEYRTANGDVVRSAPVLARDSSGATTLTCILNDQINVSTPNLCLTQKFRDSTTVLNDVFLRVYRTEANGSIFYLDTTTNGDGRNAFASATNIAIQTGTADATIIANEQLYTTGGILPNYPLPACDDLIVHKNRVYGISSENKKEIVFTNVRQDGEVPQWHPFLTVTIDDGGPAIGLATMDDRVVVFKKDSIWVIYGNGPDRKGVNSDHVIQRVPTEHGCIDRRSIVLTPIGLFFQSRRGIMLLSRGAKDVTYIGGPVEDYLALTPIITAATALTDDERVYFWTTDSGMTGGYTLVYHWDVEQWAYDRVYLGEENALNFATSAAYVEGEYYVSLYGENETFQHTGAADDVTGWNNFITLSIQTSWIKLTGMQGFKRVRAMELLGYYHGHHGLSVGVFRDYVDSAVQTVTWSRAELTAAVPQYQLKHHIAQQRCEAIAFSISTVRDVPGDGIELPYRQAFFTGLALDVGSKPTMMRLPDAQQKG